MAWHDAWVSTDSGARVDAQVTHSSQPPPLVLSLHLRSAGCSFDLEFEQVLELLIDELLIDGIAARAQRRERGCSRAPKAEG
jgi:hypothetical protein